jgi:glycosyltransferase involved in cell wall biosynthesis
MENDKMEKVSLYIPCYNVAGYIARCIQGILGQTRPPAEIIVVDDGCTDKTVEIASRYPVRIVRHEVNMGLSSARNTGVRSARNDLVASIDADCLAKPDWLERLLECFQDQSTVGAGGRLIELYRTKLPDKWRALHMIQHRGPEMIVGADFLFGHSTLFRKTAIEKVGLYKEALRTNNEDEYICRKLLQGGGTLVYEPRAVVEHLRTDTVGSLLNTYWRWWFFGYKSDISLQNTLRRLANYFTKDAPSLLAIDWSAKQLDCAIVSCLAVAYSILQDIKYYAAHRGQGNLHGS